MTPPPRMPRAGAGAIMLSLTVLTAACSAAGADPSPPTSAPPAPSPAAATTRPDTSTSTTATPTMPTATSSSTTTTTTTTTTSTATTTLPDIIIGFAGDTSFTHGLAARDPLGDVARWLSAPDLMVVNLETTVAEPGVGRAATKTYVFRSPPETAALIAQAGIDVVSLANNHALDYGPDGLARTIRLVEAWGTPVVGAGADEVEAYTPVLIDVKGRTVGIVAFSHITCVERPEVAWACSSFTDRTVAAVEQAAAESDVTVVFVHWGVEKARCPVRYQRDLAALWAAAGADIIVGAHPHILQGVERIGDTWVLHSIGNWAFPSARAERADSALFEFHVSPAGESALVAKPVRIMSGRPTPADFDRKADIFAALTRHSFGYKFGPGGWAIRRNDPGGACGV